MSRSCGCDGSPLDHGPNIERNGESWRVLPKHVSSHARWTEEGARYMTGLYLAVTVLRNRCAAERNGGRHVFSFRI